MALKQYFYIVLVPLKFIPKRTASFWQTIKIPNRFVLKICTGGFADYNIMKITYLCTHIISLLRILFFLIFVDTIICTMEKIQTIPFQE